MCVVSMVTDHYSQKWPQPSLMSPDIYKDVLELIRKAKEYDAANNQAECLREEKRVWLVDLEAVGHHKPPPVNLYNMPVYKGWPYPSEN